MRNCLFATASLAFVSSPAMAADMLSVGVGGYMQQWLGMSSVDDTEKDKKKMVNDGVAQQSDSEIFFRGKLESDSGLTFSVKVELEGNNSDGATAIDESQLTIGGEFGKITLGAEDPASTLTHHGGLDVGISLNCGDTHKWIGGLAGCSHNGFGTYGHGHGDKNQIMYFSPRVSGVQFGVSYIPDTGQEGGDKALNDNENDAWAVGGNYVGDFGDGLDIAVSLGHYQADMAGQMVSYMPNTKGADTVTAGGADDKRLSQAQHAAHKAAWEKWEYLASTDKKNMVETLGDTADAQATELTNIAQMGLAGRAAITGSTSSMTKNDSKTFSNAALQIGMGSFSFGIVYATNEGGMYTAKDMPVKMTAAEMEAHDDTLTSGVAKSGTGAAGSDADATGGNATYIIDTSHMFDHDNNPKTDKVAEAAATADAAAINDPANETWMLSKVVKDGSKNWDTWGAGVKYSDGPMAMSLSHLSTEWDDGGEQEATMLSLSYTLAPGVASKSSIVMAERSMASGRKIDGTAFVTGIVVGF